MRGAYKPLYALPAAYLMVVYLLHLEVVENGLYALMYSDIVERLVEL